MSNMTCLTNSISSVSISSTSSTESDNVLCSSLLATLQDICTFCSRGRTSVSRCIDCGLYLCEYCLSEHQTAQHTKVHKIVIKTRGIVSPLPPLPETRFACYSFCDTHHKPDVAFCETCSKSACCSCVLTDHLAHKLIYLKENDLSATFGQLRSETECAKMNISRAVNSAKTMTCRIRSKVQEVSDDVEKAFQQLEIDLKLRKEALLGEIRQIYLTKMWRLLCQVDRFEAVQAKLTLVKNMLDASVNTSERELIITNETAANQLKQIRHIKSELYPCEDDNIRFKASETGFLANFGAIVTSNVNWSQDVSVVPPRLALPSNDATKSSKLSETCRTVYGVSESIILKLSWNPSLIIGKGGDGDGELCRPWGVCCNSFGHFIVTDRSNDRVQVFDAEGRFLYKFGKHGKALGEFDRPAGVTVNPDNQIVIADKDNHRIQIFKMDGSFVRTFGEKGSHPGQFSYPWDVACNSQGHIVVCDSRNHRIQLFTGTGDFVSKYGPEGNPIMWKHFDNPRSVCFTPSGNILVTDFNNHRIAIIPKDFRNVEFWGDVEGSKIKQFSRPQGVVTDDYGNIVVADSKNNRIQVFDNFGNFMYQIGRPGKNPGEFSRPQGICITPGGRIACVDLDNNRIQVF